MQRRRRSVAEALERRRQAFGGRWFLRVDPPPINRGKQCDFYVEKQIKELEFFLFLPFSLLDASFTDKSKFCQGRSVASLL